MGQIRPSVCCGLLWFVILTKSLALIIRWIFLKISSPGLELKQKMIQNTKKKSSTLTDWLCVWANLCCEFWVATWVLTMLRPCFGILNIYKLTGGLCHSPITRYWYSKLRLWDSRQVFGYYYDQVKCSRPGTDLHKHLEIELSLESEV